MRRIACITLDFELDYGSRIGNFNILTDQKDEIEKVAATYRRLDIPVSAFVVTKLLEDYPSSGDVLRSLASDFHCHSHTHNTKDFDSQYEIPTNATAFEEYFGTRPLGYRAPQGVLNNGDVELLREEGFGFSASIFPSTRPGKFSNLDKPTQPFQYDNGLMELPFAVVPRARYIISLSYIKLIGFSAFRALVAMFGLPEVLIFDSHLHDYVVNEMSFAQLPRSMKIAWGRNKYRGLDYLDSFVSLLRQKGYDFLTMSQLYSELEGQL